MKRLIFLLCCLATNICFSQTTETFETDTTGKSTFTDNNQNFTINTLEQDSGTFKIVEFANGGWNGTGTDNRFIDNSDGVNNDRDGATFSITTTDGKDITVKSFYLFVSRSFFEDASTTVTVTGKKDGNTTPIFSFIKNGVFTDVSELEPNNGYTFFDLATEGGVDNSVKEIDELIISSTGDADLLNLDAFTWDFATTSTSTTPTVSITAASAIANTSATLGGNVTDDGGATVTERGIVYSTSDNSPTIAEGATKDTNGSGTGIFSETISGLAAGTEYFYNAYAINSEGTSYGTAASFTTTGKGWTGTTSTDWATASNWSPNSVPSASDNLVIPNVTNKPIIGSGTSALSNNLTVETGSSLTVNSGASLTINGSLTQNGTFTIQSNASSNGSLIIKGTSTGNVTYNRYVSTNWHLIGAPVTGQSLNSLVGQVNTSGNKYALAPYVNTTSTLLRWNYYTDNTGTNNITTAGNFTKLRGYSVQKSTAGTISFTGRLHTDDEPMVITDGGDNPSGNRWNLIANPYTASIHGSNAADATNNFLKVNIDAGNLDASKAGLYLWTGTAPYDVKSVDDPAFYIAPGQAFFVHAPDGGGTSVSFTEAMQTHQTGNIFAKSSSSYPEIILNLTSGKSKSLTKIRYIKGKTTGLDVGSDVATFTGTGKSTFEVYSHLINGKLEDNFAIQALPNSNFEKMVVPIGVTAKSGSEISFSAEISKLPAGLRVWLEDKTNNTFTELNNNTNNYSIKLNNDLNGTGRFYVHTTSSTLAVDGNANVQNVSMQTINKSTLRITGLSVEKNEIILFNMLGKKVLSTAFTSNGAKDINLPNLSTGVYFVQLQNTAGKLTKKIILE